MAHYAKATTTVCRLNPHGKRIWDLPRGGTPFLAFAEGITKFSDPWKPFVLGQLPVYVTEGTPAVNLLLID